MTAPTTPSEETTSVPKEVFDQLVKANEDRDNARIAQIKALEERVNAPPAPSPESAVAPPKRMSRVELQKMVDDDLITDAQRDQTLADYAAEDAKAEARRIAREEVNEATRVSFLSEKIEAYRESHASAFDAKSTDEERMRLISCFKDVCETRGGYPEKGSLEEKEVEVLALKMAFGDPKRVTETTRETRQHGGEGGAPAGGTGGAPADPSKQVPEKHRAYVQHMIDCKQYTGWDDPKLTRRMKYMK